MSEASHAKALDLLPWLVNGRLGGEDLLWLNAHLEGCESCRAECASQRRIRDAVASQPVVEFAPQASFNRLWQQIEADAQVEPPRSPVRRSVPWLRVMVAAQVAIILLLGGALWQGWHRVTVPDYRTVTDSPPATGSATRVQIKAIFDDRLRLGDVTAILTGTNLSVLEGPGPTGVYTLVSADASAADPRRVDQATEAALPRLRADPRVRFAEVVTRDAPR